MKKTHYTYMSKGFILNKLPMSARIKARRNLFIQNRNRKNYIHTQSIGSSMFGHVASMFVFQDTPEGLTYWKELLFREDWK